MDKYEQTAGFLNLRDWYCDMLCVLLWQPVCCCLFQRQDSCLIRLVFWGLQTAECLFISLLSCLTCTHSCKSDTDCNWQYTVSYHCDSCPTRHLYLCIKLSNEFPCYYTTPCLAIGGGMKRQKVCHDKCYAPRNEAAVYVWRKGSKWSLFTSVQVVW